MNVETLCQAFRRIGWWPLGNTVPVSQMFVRDSMLGEYLQCFGLGNYRLFVHKQGFVILQIIDRTFHWVTGRAFHFPLEDALPLLFPPLITFTKMHRSKEGMALPSVLESLIRADGCWPDGIFPCINSYIYPDTDTHSAVSRYLQSFYNNALPDPAVRNLTFVEEGEHNIKIHLPPDLIGEQEAESFFVLPRTVFLSAEWPQRLDQHFLDCCRHCGNYFLQVLPQYFKNVPFDSDYLAYLREQTSWCGSEGLKQVWNDFFFPRSDPMENSDFQVSTLSRHFDYDGGRLSSLNITRVLYTPSQYARLQLYLVFPRDLFLAPKTFRSAYQILATVPQLYGDTMSRNTLWDGQFLRNIARSNLARALPEALGPNDIRERSYLTLEKRRIR